MFAFILLDQDDSTSLDNERGDPVDTFTTSDQK